MTLAMPHQLIKYSTRKITSEDNCNSHEARLESASEGVALATALHAHGHQAERLVRVQEQGRRVAIGAVLHRSSPCRRLVLLLLIVVLVVPSLEVVNEP